MLIARSSAQRLLVFLIDRVPSMAARAFAPTSSTPGRPCSQRRRPASSRPTSSSVLPAVVVTPALYVGARTRPPPSLRVISQSCPLRRGPGAAAPVSTGDHAIRSDQAIRSDHDALMIPMDSLIPLDSLITGRRWRSGAGEGVQGSAPDRRRRERAAPPVLGGELEERGQVPAARVGEPDLAGR